MMLHESLPLGIVWRTIWFLGTNCSSPPVVVAILVEKPPVVTIESTIVTVGSVVESVVSLSTEVMQSWL